MKRALCASVLMGFLVILIYFSGSILTYNETQIDELTSNPQKYDNTEVLVTGYAIGSPVYENDTAKIVIESSRGSKIVLIINSSLLNIYPNQDDIIYAKGIYSVSGSTSYININLVHVRTKLGQQLILLRSMVAIPIIVYFIRKIWDLVRI